MNRDQRRDLRDRLSTVRRRALNLVERTDLKAEPAAVRAARRIVERRDRQKWKRRRVLMREWDTKIGTARELLLYTDAQKALAAVKAMERELHIRPRA